MKNTKGTTINLSKKALALLLCLTMITTTISSSNLADALSLNNNNSTSTSSQEEVSSADEESSTPEVSEPTNQVMIGPIPVESTSSEKNTLTQDEQTPGETTEDTSNPVMIGPIPVSLTSLETPAAEETTEEATQDTADPYTYNINSGSIIITNGSNSGTFKVDQYGDIDDNIPVTTPITIEGNTIGTQLTYNTITINASNATSATPVKINLNSVEMSSSSTSPFTITSGYVDMTVGLGSTITTTKAGKAAINVPNGSGLTITVDLYASLTADASGSGDNGGAGIGSNQNQAPGTINIYGYGGTINAYGGSRAAGIGGGASASGGTINITGGTINATGGGTSYGGAGIGGGGSFIAGATSGGNITIGGTANIQKAQGGAGGAGIGGGCFGYSGEILIKESAKIGENNNVGAISGVGATGIGAGYFPAAGNIQTNTGTITIDTNGTVKAKSTAYTTGNKSYSGAGIGGGTKCNNNKIDIQNGNIIAESGEANFGGAGIGGGPYGAGGTIKISGTTTTVTATGGNYGAGIGGGASASGGTINISGGTINATGGGTTYGGAGIGSGGSNIQSTQITGGSITIGGTANIQKAQSGAYAAGIGGGCFGTRGTITIEGSANIGAGTNDTGAVGVAGAGIGSGFYNNSSGGTDTGTITINTSGTVKATSNACEYGDATYSGAGIGSGVGYDNGTINIYKGTIIAEAGEATFGGGAGIGGGCFGTMGAINITESANITKAQGAGGGAGIGSGYYKTDGGGTDGGKITISTSGTVNAIGSYDTTNQDGGAGIGGGAGRNNGTIEISGSGTVTAKASTSGGAAGIGGGWKGIGGTINITGSNVTAIGGGAGTGGAGIGSGGSGNTGGNITIGGTANIQEAKGGAGGAGIGGGKNGAGGTIKISGSSKVTATGGASGDATSYGAGIGGGYNGGGASLTIEGTPTIRAYSSAQNKGINATSITNTTANLINHSLDTAVTEKTTLTPEYVSGSSVTADATKFVLESGIKSYAGTLTNEANGTTNYYTLSTEDGRYISQTTGGSCNLPTDYKPTSSTAVQLGGTSYFDIVNGSINITQNATTKIITVTQTGVTTTTSNFPESAPIYIYQSNDATSYNITVADGVGSSTAPLNITLGQDSKGASTPVNIKPTSGTAAGMDIKGSSNVSLTLAGTSGNVNKLTGAGGGAGLQVQNDGSKTATVTIKGDGALEATGSTYTSGSYTYGGAGIGGAGIGSGYFGTNAVAADKDGKITINTSKAVNAKGSASDGYGSAGIGGGVGYSNGTININSGTIKTEAGDATYGGAGIGGGYKGSGGTINIRGSAEVTATGSGTTSGGAGIGSGGDNTTGGSLTITPTTDSGTTYTPTIRAYSPKADKAVNASVSVTEGTTVNYLAGNLKAAVGSTPITLTPAFSGTSSETDTDFVLPGGTMSYFGTMKNAATSDNYYTLTDKSSSPKQYIYTTESTPTTHLNTKSDIGTITYTAVQLSKLIPESEVNADVSNDNVSVVWDTTNASEACWAVTYKANSTDTNTTTKYLKSGGKLNITGTTNANIISVTGDDKTEADKLNVSLTNVDIAPSTAVSPMSITGTANVTLTLSGKNTLNASSATGKAGLEVSEGNSVTITGSGVLEASGGTDAAGIGSSASDNKGNLTIEGTPTIRAYSPVKNNAINANLTNTAGVNLITHNLSTPVGTTPITLTPKHNDSTIETPNFVLPAGTTSYAGTLSQETTGENYYTLKANDGRMVRMANDNANIKMKTATEIPATYTPVTLDTNVLDLNEGKIVISKDGNNIKVKQTTAESGDITYSLAATTPIYIYDSKPGENKANNIVVETGVGTSESPLNITLGQAGVNGGYQPVEIEAKSTTDPVAGMDIKGDSVVDLTLAGTSSNVNKLTGAGGGAGLQVQKTDNNNTATVTIKGTGALEAKGSASSGDTTYGSAGIGGSGSSTGYSGGNINITGGTITAAAVDATNGGAGIGGGYKGTMGTINIGTDTTASSANITANGAAGGAGIGSGYCSEGGSADDPGSITIKTSGTVTAKGGVYTSGSYNYGGAGIGGGVGYNNGTVNILSGNVDARAIEATNGTGAGIGGGAGGAGGKINISGSSTVMAVGGDGGIIATSDKGGAGIGGGYSGAGGDVTISDSSLIINTTGGGTATSGGAGIGSGGDNNIGGTLKIEGTPTIRAYSPKKDKAINAEITSNESANLIKHSLNDTTTTQTDGFTLTPTYVKNGEVVVNPEDRDFLLVQGINSYAGTLKEEADGTNAGGYYILSTRGEPQNVKYISKTSGGSNIATEKQPKSYTEVQLDTTKASFDLKDGSINIKPDYTNYRMIITQGTGEDTEIYYLPKNTPIYIYYTRTTEISNNIVVEPGVGTGAGIDPLSITLGKSSATSTNYQPVNIKASSGAAMDIQGSSRVDLTLAGTKAEAEGNPNKLTGAGGGAGLQVQSYFESGYAITATVTIKGTGALEAKGSADGNSNGSAGIGGSANASGSSTYSGGNINIEGGTITATAGKAILGGAGIGGGYNGSGGTINITTTTDGISTTVNATGYGYGAGIGGGYKGDGGTINISGSAVITNAQGSGNESGGAGIGGGGSGSMGKIEISDSAVITNAQGDGGGAGIGSGANISDVKDDLGKITISTTGIVNAQGGTNDGDYYGGAGIGGGWGWNNGTDQGSNTVGIYITGGNINAKAGGRIDADGSAGIGGGAYGGGGTINISGGTIENAQGNGGGAGIGGGYNGAGGTIKISDKAEITNAKGGGNEEGGAGIGGGSRGSMGKIEISGSASIGSTDKAGATGGGTSWGGAGIGSGYNDGTPGESDPGSITINTTETVNAQGKNGGAGIGGGWGWSNGSEAEGAGIYITGGNIIAKGDGGATNGGAGIGGGDGGDGGTIKISATNPATTTVTATGGGTKYGGAGIGGGYNGSMGTINITDDAVITKAQGAAGGAGIGSGYNNGDAGEPDPGSITIKTIGTVKAQGIGGGSRWSNGNASKTKGAGIYITGGNIIAKGDGGATNGGAGIGGGYNGAGGTIEIAGSSTVTATGGGNADWGGAGIGGGSGSQNNGTLTITKAEENTPTIRAYSPAANKAIDVTNIANNASANLISHNLKAAVTKADGVTLKPTFFKSDGSQTTDDANFVLPKGTQSYFGTTENATSDKDYYKLVDNSATTPQYIYTTTAPSTNHLTTISTPGAPTYTGVELRAPYELKTEINANVNYGNVKVEWNDNAGEIATGPGWAVTYTKTEGADSTTEYLDAAEGTLNITGQTDKYTISVKGSDQTEDDKLSATLNDVDIASTSGAPMSITGTADLTLSLANGSTNILDASSSSNKYGLNILSANVTIDGTGVLEANGGTDGAGIGGSGATLKITSKPAITTAGTKLTDIANVTTDEGGLPVIYGAMKNAVPVGGMKVTQKSGKDKYNTFTLPEDTTQFMITGADTATHYTLETDGVNLQYDINGDSATSTDFTAKTDISAVGYIGIEPGTPIIKDEVEADISAGNVIVTWDTTYSCWKVEHDNGAIDYLNSNVTSSGSMLTIQGTTEQYAISVTGSDRTEDDKLNVSLTDVNIAPSTEVSPMSIKNTANVTLTLSGKNTLRAYSDFSKAGLEVSEGNSATITGNGALEATGGANAAGIGTGGNLTIANTPTIRAYSPQASKAVDASISVTEGTTVNYLAGNLKAAVENTEVDLTPVFSGTPSETDTDFVLPGGTRSYFGTMKNDATSDNYYTLTDDKSDPKQYIYTDETIPTTHLNTTTATGTITYTAVQLSKLIPESEVNANVSNGDVSAVWDTTSASEACWEVIYKASSIDANTTTEYLSPSGKLNITGETTTNIIAVNGTGQLNVTLDGVNIKLGEDATASPMEIIGGANVNLTLADDKTNTLDAMNVLNNKAGLEAGTGALTITNDGNGALEALGGGTGTGITADELILAPGANVAATGATAAISATTIKSSDTTNPLYYVNALVANGLTTSDTEISLTQEGAPKTFYLLEGQNAFFTTVASGAACNIDAKVGTEADARHLYTTTENVNSSDITPSLVNNTGGPVATATNLKYSDTLINDTATKIWYAPTTDVTTEADANDFKELNSETKFEINKYYQFKTTPINATDVSAAYKNASINYTLSYATPQTNELLGATGSITTNAQGITTAAIPEAAQSADVTISSKAQNQYYGAGNVATAAVQDSIPLTIDVPLVDAGLDGTGTTPITENYTGLVPGETIKAEPTNEEGVTGVNYNYTWQYSKDAGDNPTWNNVPNNAKKIDGFVDNCITTEDADAGNPSYSTLVTSTNDGYRYRVVVTPAGTLYSGNETSIDVTSKTAINDTDYKVGIRLLDGTTAEYTVLTDASTMTIGSRYAFAVGKVSTTETTKLDPTTILSNDSKSLVYEYTAGGTGSAIGNPSDWTVPAIENNTAIDFKVTGSNHYEGTVTAKATAKTATPTKEIASVTLNTDQIVAGNILQAKVVDTDGNNITSSCTYKWNKITPEKTEIVSGATYQTYKVPLDTAIGTTYYVEASYTPEGGTLSTEISATAVVVEDESNKEVTPTQTSAGQQATLTANGQYSSGNFGGTVQNTPELKVQVTWSNDINKIKYKTSADGGKGGWELPTDAATGAPTDTVKVENLSTNTVADVQYQINWDNAFLKELIAKGATGIKVAEDGDPYQSSILGVTLDLLTMPGDNGGNKSVKSSATGTNAGDDRSGNPTTTLQKQNTPGNSQTTYVKIDGSIGGNTELKTNSGRYIIGTANDPYVFGQVTVVAGEQNYFKATTDATVNSTLEGQTATFSIANPQAGYEYVWSIDSVAGGTVTEVTGYNSADFKVTGETGTTVTVSVVVTDNYGIQHRGTGTATIK